MQSQSEYELGQQGSGQDFQPSEQHVQRLRPNPRQKYILSDLIPYVEREGSGLGQISSRKIASNQFSPQTQGISVYFMFQAQQIRNTKVVQKEPKLTGQRRQTRGIRNGVTSQFSNARQASKLDADVDQDGYLIGQRQGDEGPPQQDDDYSIFNPEVGLIIWRRDRQTSQPSQQQQQQEFLIKFKGRSYIHTEWLTQKQIEALGKPIKNKINRFNKNFNKRLIQMDYDEDAVSEGKYFDQSYLEVDRILTATEMFPIIHQKKANEIKGKWSESLMIVCSKLLNFTRNGIFYGVSFCEPVNPERDSCVDYPKIVPHPMDLGTVMNKIYLDLYKTAKDFWNDIGLVWKNCLKYNKDEGFDIRVLGQTERECTIFLYDQWYHLCEERYNKLKQQMAHLYDQQKREQVNLNIRNKNQEMAPQNQISNLQQNKNNQKKEEKINNLTCSKDKQVSLKSQAQIKEEQNIAYFQNGIEQKQQKQQIENAEKANKQLQKMEIESPNFEKIEALEVAQDKSQNCKNMGLKKADQNNELQGSGSSSPMMEERRQMDLQTPHPSQQMGDNQEERQLLNMEDFYSRNIFLTTKKVEGISCKQDIQMLHPGEFSYAWLDYEGGKGQSFMEHSYEFIDFGDMKRLDLNVQVDRVYMVKWKNLSYSQATWECQSTIGCPEKIMEFKQINKALGKDHRVLMESQRDKHRVLVDLQINPKKRSKYSFQTISDFKNKLYFLDVLNRKQPYQYISPNIPVYKNYKLLRSYQLDSLNWLIKAWYEKRNTILADQMGLGKTIQSIAFLYHLYTMENVKGPFLIIAPLSTLEHWKRTIEDWTSLNCVLYYDQNGQSGRRSIQYYQWFYTNITMKGNYLSSQLNKFQILLTSYEVFLLDFPNVIFNVPFQHIVVDQAHRLKNKNAKILATLKRLPCRRVLLLTGTPIQNNTGELWSLLNYIEPDKFARFQDFKRQFGDLSCEQQVDKLNRNLKPFMLRRMKEDVEQSIPPLQQTIIDVEMTNIQKTIYRALFQKNKNMLIKGLSASTSCNTNLNNLEIQLRKCCNHPFLIKELENDLLRECTTQKQKIDKLISASGKMVLVKMLLDKYKKEGKKVLIFSQFTHMLHLIEQFLRFFQYKYERIDGQIKAKERQAAIDRYNNPEKKRDVFLLSTKAGGIGINLTSANVVIIYDSDWNPQNDVQATARAHRIGQKSQVNVYRLVTSNTYETEMFERATQKLGLDKAIFIGGTFKETGAKDTAHKAHGQPNVKLSKTQMQTLLKKGILGFLENQGEQAYFDEDVDRILQKKSRIANYSVVSGAMSVEKRRFQSAQSDKNLNLNDPNFWNIVLKNVESPTQHVLKKIKESATHLTQAQQLQIMMQSAELVNTLIENKLSLSGFNADDEVNLSEFLTIVNSQRKFNKHYRDLASTWLEEVCKPSRRFKKITPEDLVIGSKPAQNKRNLNLRSNQQENGIFGDEEANIQDEQDDQSEDKVKLNEQKRQQLLKKICCLCEKPKCTIHCSGFCKRAFHQQCKKKVQTQEITNSQSLNDKFEPRESHMDSDVLKNMIDASIQCKDCNSNLVCCFICKKRGQYFGAEYQKSKKNSKKLLSASNLNKDGQIFNENGAAQDKQQAPQHLSYKSNTGKRRNQVTKCSTANCAKFYHPKCIEQFDTKKHFRYIDLNSLHFRCSLHYCNICGISGDTMSIFQCIRCPKALHIRCMDKDKVVKISKKLFICDSHFRSKKDLKKCSQRFASCQPAKKVALKAQKAQTKKKQKKVTINAKQEQSSSQQNSEIIDESKEKMQVEQPQNQGVKRTSQQFKVDIQTSSKGNHNYKTRKNRDNVWKSQIKAAPTNQKLLDSYYVEDSEKQAKKIKLKDKSQLLTYEQLNLVPVKEFDFSNYEKDWCRYCGSRYSSNFTQGPWGSKTLCTVHYINWKQNKSLNLDAYKDKMPQKPINPDCQQELKFLTNYHQKNPGLKLTELAEYTESRKIKKGPLD